MTSISAPGLSSSMAAMIASMPSDMRSTGPTAFFMALLPLEPVDVDVLQRRDTGLGDRQVRGQVASLVAHDHVRVPLWQPLAPHVLGHLGSDLAHGVRIQHDDQLGDKIIVESGIDGDGLWIR